MRVKVESLRAELADVLRGVSQEPVTVTRYGEAIAVIVTPQDFEELTRLRGLYRNRSSSLRNGIASFRTIGQPERPRSV
jgi:prevent-host-death family protein